MRILRNVRLVIALVIGIPIAIFGAVMAVQEYFSGTGTLHVVAPAEATLTVMVDGAERASLAPGGHRELELEQGDHRIELVRGDGQGSVRELDIDDGFYEGLLPAANQCFVELDGTEAYYGSASRPEYEDRYFDHEPFDVGSSRYFSENSIPSQIQDGSHVYLIFEVPCSMAEASDAQLVTAAGYGG